MLTKKNALDPAYRDEVCDHQFLHYRARWGMPCTGPVVCDMCGGQWETMEDAKEERARVIEALSN